MISDQFVKKILSPVLLFIFVCLLAPAILTFIVVYKTDFLRGSEPEIVLSIIDIFKNFKGLPKDVISLIMQTLPALVGTLCYRNSSAQTLNFIGYVAFVILIFGVFLSFGLIFFLDPSNIDQVRALEAGKEGVQLLKSSCEATLRTSMTYLFLIIGLQIKIHNNNPN
jgi:hypothetical protein